jgi:hypothetical protein
MSTSLISIRDQLIKNVKHQRAPTTYVNDDYLDLAILGAKRLYVDSGIESSWDTEYSSGATPTISRTLNLTQIEYCVVASEIEFFKSIRNWWNILISYTTDALTVSNAFKPFDFLNLTIEQKENRLLELFYKLPNTSTMTPVTSITVTTLDVTYE